MLSSPVRNAGKSEAVSGTYAGYGGHDCAVYSASREETIGLGGDAEKLPCARHPFEVDFCSLFEFDP